MPHSSAIRMEVRFEGEASVPHKKNAVNGRLMRADMLEEFAERSRIDSDFLGNGHWPANCRRGIGPGRQGRVAGECHHGREAISRQEQRRIHRWKGGRKMFRTEHLLYVTLAGSPFANSFLVLIATARSS